MTGRGTPRRTVRRGCFIQRYATGAAGGLAGPERSRSGGQDLGLLALELLGRDDSAVAQVSELGKLVRGGSRTCGLLDVAAEFLLRLLLVPRGPLLHLAAAGD